MKQHRSDITCRQDLTQVISSFYDKLTSDKRTSPIFEHLDIASHVPTIVNFWEAMILNGTQYQGNPFEKHVRLSLEKEHFDIWLFYFNETLDEFHQGEKVEMMKFRAKTIATIWSSKML